LQHGDIRVSTWGTAAASATAENPRADGVSRPHNAENGVTWGEVFEDLRRRGLKEVGFVVPNASEGLKDALRRSYPGAEWQRCSVHFVRNVVARIRAGDAADLKALLVTSLRLRLRFVTSRGKNLHRILDLTRRPVYRLHPHSIIETKLLDRLLHNLQLVPSKTMTVGAGGGRLRR